MDSLVLGPPMADQEGSEDLSEDSGEEGDGNTDHWGELNLDGIIRSIEGVA